MTTHSIQCETKGLIIMPKPLLPDRPMTRFERSAALASFVAGCLFALLLLGLHLVEPEFDPTRRFVSEYALGGAGWMMTVAFVSLAISLLAAALAVVRHVRTIFGYVGLAILLWICRVGDPGPRRMWIPAGGSLPDGPDHHRPRRPQLLRSDARARRSLDYSPVGMLLISWALGRTDGWRSLRRPMMIAASIAFLLMIWLTAALPIDYHFGPGVYAGLIAQILLLSYLGWIITVSLAVRRRPAGRQRRSGESARSAVISAVSACGNGPRASTEAFSRACCSVRMPGKGMIDGSRAKR
jgi:hypothetical protein